MLTKKILQQNYTLNRKFYQLKLPFDIEFIIPDNDSVRLLNQFVDDMHLTELYSTYSKTRENQVSPMNMLKIMLYGYMNGLYSSRDIETACRRDINFMFLLEGASPPDHSTFARFRSLHFAPCAEKILTEVTNFLYKIGEISGESIFIDGTKIEACANKYTFVWKKAITKNMAKLLTKIADLVKECEEFYGIKLIYKDKVQMKHVKKLRKKLYELKKLEGIEFVHGCGKKKTTLQKSIEKLEEYLLKFKEYNKKVYTCGNRNSYSKTDADATFMRMKEDAMKNGQLKPAYNVQHGVDAVGAGTAGNKAFHFQRGQTGQLRCNTLGQLQAVQGVLAAVAPRPAGIVHLRPQDDRILHAVGHAGADSGIFTEQQPRFLPQPEKQSIKHYFRLQSAQRISGASIV